MNSTKNKQGQALGQKGLMTRQKLMEATRRLLVNGSPMELTAVAIAKEAKISSASFYLYFDDVPDVLYSLAEIAGETMLELHRIVDEPWAADSIEKHAKKLVETLNDIWKRNREVLRFRNLEADRGDPRFEELRMNTYIPFIEHFAQRILALNPPGNGRRRSDVYAEAVVLHAAMERLAATEPQVVEKGLGIRRLNAALARVISLALTPRDAGVEGQEKAKPKAGKRQAAAD